MGNVLRSKDDQINLAQTYGMWNQSFYLISTNSGQVSAVDRGGITLQRNPYTLTYPSVDTGLTGWYCTRATVQNQGLVQGIYVAIETVLGSLNLATNTFTDNDAMPTRTIKGASVQTAAQMIIGYCTTALSATTPTITITYTDQNGNTGNTAAITTATNPTQYSTFRFDPYLASGDTGLVDITAASTSAGSSGTMTFYGLRLIADFPSNSYPGGYQPGRLGKVPWIGAAGEKIAVYTQGTSNVPIVGHLSFVVDN